MIRSRLLAGIAAAALTLATTGVPGVPGTGPQAVQAQQVNISFNVFFTQLQPFGIWVAHPEYNFVWCPLGVAQGWRPYTNGRWIFTSEFGWFFQSEEPFAWATYHYGRWFSDARLGWCWVPGTQWAPAWVTWRSSGDTIGWAPLPPTRPGFVVTVEVNVTVPDTIWIFVPVVRFTQPDLRVVVIFADQDPSLITQTEILGPVVIQNNIVINNVIDINFVQENTDEEIPIFDVEEASEPTAPSVDGTTLDIYTGNAEEPTAEDVPPEAVEVEEAVEVIEESEPAPDAEAVPEAEAEDGTEAEGEAEPDAADEAPAEDGAVAPEDADAETDGEAADPATDDAAAEPDAEVVPPDADGDGQPDCLPEELVDGVCPVIDDATTEDGAATDPATEDAAEEAPPADEAAPTDEAAPPEETVPEEAAPEGDVPAAEEEPATDEATPEPAPAEEPAPEEAAPAEDAAAPEEPAPAPEAPVCPEGQLPNRQGVCVPIDAGAGDAPAEAPAEEAPAQ
jgi:hypothetical protein